MRISHQLCSDWGKLLNEVLGGVVESDEHDVEVTLRDPKVKVEAHLLLGCQLRHILHMFKLKWQVFLFFKWMFFLFIS